MCAFTLTVSQPGDEPSRTTWTAEPSRWRGEREAASVLTEDQLGRNLEIASSNGAQPCTVAAETVLGLLGACVTTEIPAPIPGSIRALIAELAQIEDAVRRAGTYAAADDSAGPVLNPELIALWRREAELVAELRRVSVQ